jgi:class 3 adenylate cyclase
MRENSTPESLRGAMSAALEVDVSGLLSQVKAPTLVLDRRAWPARARDAARALASQIPAARLVALEGESLVPYQGDMESVAGAIDEFLSDAAPANEASDAPASPAPTPSAVATILFTDIVGHTEMMQRLGDAKGRVVLREHERITRETLKQHGGAEVKTDGDSFMASFTSVSAAVECAVTLQRAFATHSSAANEPIVVRIGLNVGEPIEEEGDFFGSAVILSARIKDQAGPGEILVPEAVRHLLTGKDFLFSDRGDFTLKGFEDPVRLYEVRWQAERPATLPP